MSCAHFIYLFIFVRKREREGGSTSWGGPEREWIPRRLHITSAKPDMGLELMDCETMTWAEVGGLTDWATQAPLTCAHFKTWTLNNPAVHSWRAMNTLGNNWCHTPLCLLAYSRGQENVTRRDWLLWTPGRFWLPFIRVSMPSQGLPTASGSEPLRASVHWRKVTVKSES